MNKSSGKCREDDCKNLTIAAGAIVNKEVEVVGEVSIGTKTIVHPKASFLAEAGPIIIGEGNLIEERVKFINRWPEGCTPGAQPRVMRIGDNNVFEVGAVCGAQQVGDNNVLEAKARVGGSVRLTNGCVVGALCSLDTDETLEENSVVCGEPQRRRTAQERPLPQTMQLDFLSKILPNYHYIKKPTKPKA